MFAIHGDSVFISVNVHLHDEEICLDCSAMSSPCEVSICIQNRFVFSNPILLLIIIVNEADSETAKHRLVCCTCFALSNNLGFGQVLLVNGSQLHGVELW